MRFIRDVITKSDNIAVTVSRLTRVVMADGCGGGLYFTPVLLLPVGPIHKEMSRGVLITVQLFSPLFEKQ